MSNRSSVIIAISNEITIPEDIINAMSDADCQNIEVGNYNARYWFWESVKWLPFLYKELERIEKFLESIDDNKYGFIELGEYNEVEERGLPSAFGIGFKMEITKPFEEYE